MSPTALSSPSPLRGEGRGEGEISSTPPAVPFVQAFHPLPNPSPLKGEGLECLLLADRPHNLPVCRHPAGDRDWGAFRAEVAGLATALADRSERRWLLCEDDAWRFATRLFALLHAGRIPVLPPNCQPGTLERLARAWEAQLAGDLPPAPGAKLHPLDPDAARIELYTSGSSGEPKCVTKTLRQLSNEVAALEAQWGNEIGDATVVATVPHLHIYGLLFRLLWPLAAGRPFDVRVHADPHTLCARLAELGETVLVSSPAHLQRIPELIPLAALQPVPRRIFSSGGPLNAATAAVWHDGLGRTPIEVYGSTESGGIAWRVQEGGDDAWTPLPGVHVAAEADGALLLDSPFLADAAPMRLEDAVDLLGDGRFRLRGRLDRIVKIEEKRLSLPDMEAWLRRHPWVAEAAAVALGERRRILGAAVVLSPTGREQLAESGRKPLIQALRAHLSEAFESVLLPRRWRFPARLPYDERGKLAAASLADLFAEDPTPLLPMVLGEAREGQQARLRLRIPADLVHFAGHFPGHPILPGVVQVDWAARFGRERFALAGAFRALEQLKFQAVVFPEAELTLTLQHDPARGRLEFRYADGERVYSSGRLVFG